MNERTIIIHDRMVYQEIRRLSRSNTRLTIFALAMAGYAYLLRKAIERHEKEIKELKKTEEE